MTRNETHWLWSTQHEVQQLLKEIPRTGVPGPAVDLQRACNAFLKAVSAVMQRDSLDATRESLPHVDVTEMVDDAVEIVERARRNLNQIKLIPNSTEEQVDEALKGEASTLINLSRQLLAAYDTEDQDPDFRQTRADIRFIETLTDTRATQRLATKSARDVVVAKQVLEEQRVELAKFQTQQREALRALKSRQGSEAQETLAQHFTTLGDDERATAFRLRIATFLFVCAAPAPAVFFASQESLENGALVGGGVAVAIAAVALYLGRLADGHMKVARWSQTLGVQARGVHHFADAIDDETARVSVLQAFGLHAYLGQPAQDANAEVPPSTVAELERLARSLSDASSRPRGASGP